MLKALVGNASTWTMAPVALTALILTEQ